MEKRNLDSSSNIKTSKYFHIDDQKVVCEICPRQCQLPVGSGKRGFCFIRGEHNGTMALFAYGLTSGMAVDPMEKKPLYHFFPGESILSFGAIGCNLACKFCQNWHISRAKDVQALSNSTTPEMIVEMAKKHRCRAIAYTYNEPIIALEFVTEVARLAKKEGIYSVAVTAGYINPNQARKEFFSVMDAANVDLKAFSEEFYRKLTGGVKLSNILDNLCYLKNETKVWLEITNLIIPGCNDSETEIKKLCEWICKNLGPEVPLHFSAFHPDWELTDVENTPAATLFRAREIANSHGLYHVYIGNLRAEKSNTYCQNPQCRSILIAREGYHISSYELDKGGRCNRCGHICGGVFN